MIALALSLAALALSVFTLLSARQNYRQAVRRRDEARAARIAREARAAAAVGDEWPADEW
jgi:hypothetical protein